MNAWDTLRGDLVSLGAISTTRGNFVIACAGFDMLIRGVTHEGADRVVFLAPIARADECDLARGLAVAARLVIGSPVVIGDALMLRYVLALEVATPTIIRRAIITLANDTIAFEPEVRRARANTLAYPCFTD